MNINLYNQPYRHRILTSDINNSSTCFVKSQVLSSGNPHSSNHSALQMVRCISKWVKTQPHTCTLIKIQLKTHEHGICDMPKHAGDLLTSDEHIFLHVNLVIKLRVINLLYRFHLSFWKLKSVPAGVVREMFQGLKGDGAIVPWMAIYDKIVLGQ